MLPEPDGRQQRIALLVDADNVSVSVLDPVLTELSRIGVVNIRRAYGNWSKPELAKWKAQLLDSAVRPVQQFDYTRGKNASDMALTVDAMELLYTERPDAFGIVSSDSDFTPLVMHLRAKGALVYGFGSQKAPGPFVNACSRFLRLDALGAPVIDEDAQAVDETSAQGNPAGEEAGTPPLSSRVPSQALRQDTGLMNLLRGAVSSAQDESGWARVGAVGQKISNRASFDARNYGYATLSKLLKATDLFEWRDEKTSSVSVRYRPDPGDAQAVARILAVLPANWAPGEEILLNQLGQPLRQQGIWRGSAALYHLFARYPNYFTVVTENGNPRKIRLTRRPPTADRRPPTAEG